MKSGIKELCSVMCSMFCAMAIVSTYLSVTRGIQALHVYGIFCFLIGAAIGFAALVRI